MSDGNGPTFDEAFASWDELLAGSDKPTMARLRTFLATVRSEMDSRQRLIEGLKYSLTHREEEIEAVCALTGAQVRDGMEGRIAAVKTLVYTLEEARRVRDLKWEQAKASQAEVVLLTTEREAALSILRELVNHECTAHGDTWQRACDLLVKAEEAPRG